jgi:hypothetical protein
VDNNGIYIEREKRKIEIINIDVFIDFSVIIVICRLLRFKILIQIKEKVNKTDTITNEL